jgi:hypothetical protein
MTTHQQDPLNAFMEAHSEIDDLLTSLKDHCDNHFDVDPETINWGHVGNVTAIRQTLKVVLDFVEGKE